MMLREEESDDNVSFKERNSFGDAIWSDWFDVIKYKRTDEYYGEKITANVYKEHHAGIAFANEIPDSISVRGVYEWKWKLTDGEGNEKSLVFYCGSSSSILSRVRQERRFDLACFRHLANRIMEFIEINHDRNAIFYVRRAEVQDYVRAERDLLAQYDYVCNHKNNGECRIEDGVAELQPEDASDEEDEEDEESSDEGIKYGEDDDDDYGDHENKDHQQALESINEFIGALENAFDDLDVEYHDELKDRITEFLSENY